MSSSFHQALGSLYPASLDRERAVIWGDAVLSFEDKDKVQVAVVKTGWMAQLATNLSQGIAELEINIAPQGAVTEAVLQSGVRFVVLKGRRHEKRTYEYLTDVAERHQLRFQAIGEAV